MQTITIIGDNISQKAIEAFKAMAQAMDPKYKIKYVNSSKEKEKPTEQTLLDLKNAKSVGFYKNHDDLINEIKQENHWWEF